jgi:ubiquinol-cytochrome c reductase cytochrome c1 subunit
MIKKTLLTAFVALGLSFVSTTANAAGGGDTHIEDYDFSFEGPFGKFDQNQLQRGLKVYTEVCAACHGLRHVAFRTLGDAGGPEFPEDQVKAYAAEFDIYDAEKDEDLPGKPSDKFPASALENAPDLSLMAKARAGFHGPNGLGINQIVYGMGGAEYIASLMTGFDGHEEEQAGSVLYGNTAFPGGLISMAPPLEDGQVDFDDGHPNDVEHMAQDVAAFLMWTAEPKMMARKRMGLLAVLFLGFFTNLLYLTNKKLWAPIKRKS